MKVICKEIFDNNGNTVNKKTNGWLTVDQIYIPLSVIITQDNEILVEIIPDDNLIPITQNFRQFDIVSNRIPSNWVVFSNEIVRIGMCPRNWIYENWIKRGGRYSFMEDFLDNMPLAIEVFEKEKQIIYTEENETD